MTSTITTPLSPSTPFLEGTDAISKFTLSSPLTSATIVGSTLTSANATDGSDYTGFDVRMGDDVNALWTPVTGGQFTLNAGYSDFYLRTHVTADSIIESDETVTFVVSQLDTSVGLSDSWWVSSTLQLADAETVTASKITSVTLTTEKTVTEGNDAVAKFAISNSGLDAAAKVDISFICQGTDYRDFDGGLSYSTDNGANWTTPFKSTIELAKDTTVLELKLKTAEDSDSESGEAVTFVVSQTEVNPALTDSWWVSSSANIVDHGAVGSIDAVKPIVINAPINLASVKEGNDSVVSFTFKDATTGLDSKLGADAKVVISATGWGADTSDFTGGNFYYHVVTNGDTAPAIAEHTGSGDYWQSAGFVGVDTQITLAKDATGLQLAVNLVDDQSPEFGESVNFAVSQTATSNAITNSWWKSATVKIADNAVEVTPVTIEAVGANPTTAVTEGHDAVATYQLGGALGTGGADVNISATGWGADVSDFVNGALYYRVKTTGNFDAGAVGSSSWTKAAGFDGVIHLDAGVTGLQLGVGLIDDHVPENYEAVNFVVSQTSSGGAIKDSWYQSSTVKIDDAVVGDTYTGGLGRDIFRIPDGSIAQAGKFITIKDFVASEDKIDLGMFDFTGSVSKITKLNETAVLDLISQKSLLPDGFNDNGAMMYKVGSDAYLLVDENTDNAVDLTSDIFVKIVGGGSITTQEIAACLS